jgi:hypothetical protein
LGVSRESRFQSRLKLCGWITRKCDLIFNNIKSRAVEDNSVVFAKIAIYMIAIVSVIDHILGKRSIEAIPDIDVGLSTTLKQVTPRLEDTTLMRQFSIKPLGDANGEMVAIKSTPNWRMHGEEPTAWLEVLQHSLECKRQPIDVLKARDGED